MHGDDLSARLARAVSLASETPPAGSLPFWIGDEPAGLLIPRAQAALKALAPEFTAPYVWETDRVRLDPARCPEGVDAHFAAIAPVLHAAHAFRQWRNELLDVRSLFTNAVLAHAERGLFRFFGWTTVCVHLAARRNGAWWMSLRSRTKQVQPGRWDTLAGGMLSAGETPETGLARETAEEAGLEPHEYVTGPSHSVTLTRNVFDGWMREVNITVLADVLANATPANRDGEVEAIELVTSDVLSARIDEGSVTPEASVSFLAALLMAQETP